jgi:hypothetical protein
MRVVHEWSARLYCRLDEYDSCIADVGGTDMRKVILLLCIAFSVVDTAAADPITVTFEGTLDRLDPPEAGHGRANPFGLGDPFRFAITFNQPTSTEIMVVPPNPDIGLTATAAFFSEKPGSFTATVGETRLSGSALVSGGVRHDISDDFMNLIIEASDADPDTQGFDYFISGMGQWLSTAEWPTDVAGAFRMAPQHEFLIADIDRSARFASGPFTHVTQTPAAPVPEPTTLLMLGSGVLGVAGARRWRQRKA